MTLSAFRGTIRALDASEEDDLGHYIRVTRIMKELADPLSERILGVGLKGTGKTAAYRFLVEFDPAVDEAIGIRPPDYSISLDTSELNHSVCQKQFSNDLVIEALRHVSCSETTAVDAGLKRKARALFSKYKKLITAANGRFGGLSILGCGFTVNQPQSRTLVGLQGDDDNRPALDLLAEICDSGARIRIVIDDPELIFSETRQLDTHFLGGLFRAALKLSSKIPNLKVILLLKSHVFLPVMRDFEDFDKYPWSHLRFSWSPQELLEVVEERMAWAKVSWSELIPDTDPNDIRETILNQVCSHLRTGPRELFFWLETELAERAEHGHRRLDFATTQRSLAKYSLASLARSHNEQYPRIAEVIEHVFRNHREAQFDPRGLSDHIRGLKAENDDFRSLWKGSWLQSETPNTISGVLFNVGALALSVNGRWVLPYEADYREERFEVADSLRLAPALAEAI